MTEQQARENELRGTQAAIEDAAHALGVMTAFNRVGITAGPTPIPACSKNILRGEWGFQGSGEPRTSS